MATALDRWDEEGGAQDVAWPLPYEASDLRDVERRTAQDRCMKMRRACASFRMARLTPSQDGRERLSSLAA